MNTTSGRTCFKAALKLLAALSLGTGLDVIEPILVRPHLVSPQFIPIFKPRAFYQILCLSIGVFAKSAPQKRDWGVPDDARCCWNR
jgi:hypothetical protein